MLFFTIVNAMGKIGFASKLSKLTSDIALVITMFFAIISLKVGDNIRPVAYTIINDLVKFLLFGMCPTGMFVKSANSLTLNNFITNITCTVRVPLFVVLIKLVCLIRMLSIVLRMSCFGTARKGEVFGVTPVRRRFRLYK